MEGKEVGSTDFCNNNLVFIAKKNLLNLTVRCYMLCTGYTWQILHGLISAFDGGDCNNILRFPPAGPRRLLLRTWSCLGRSFRYGLTVSYPFGAIGGARGLRGGESSLVTAV